MFGGMRGLAGREFGVCECAWARASVIPHEKECIAPSSGGGCVFKTLFRGEKIEQNSSGQKRDGKGGLIMNELGARQARESKVGRQERERGTV